MVPPAGGLRRPASAMESPACLDTVEVAVDTTARAPRHAVSSDAGSFRSARNTSAPRAIRLFPGSSCRWPASAQASVA